MSTINWENALGGDWSVGTNWELGLVPTGDTEIALPGVYNVSISGDVAAANLAISASGATLAESAAGSLTLSGSLSLYNGAVFLNGANSIEGSVEVIGGLLAVGNGGALGNGFALLSGGVLLATTSQTLTTGLDFSGTPTIAAAPGQTLSLQGAQQLDGPVTLTFGEPSETGIILWGGSSFQLSGGTPDNLDIRDGELVFGNIDDGLAFLSSAWNSVDIEAGATLDLGGVPSSFDNLTGGGTLTGSETSSVTIGGGTFSGNLTGYLNLIITGQVVLAGSSRVGSIEIGNGGTFTSLTNDVGGLLDLDTASNVSIAPGASSAYFVNDGTVLRSGFSGAATVSVPFYNYGTLRVTAGSLTFTDGLANSGVVEGRLSTSGGTTTVTPDEAENDFNGNGLSDVLLEYTSGTLAEWMMNASAITSSGTITDQGQNATLYKQYSVAGVGDLNGDGKADVLISDSDGTFYDWNLNGPVLTSTNELTSQNQPVDLGPSSPWKVAGLGDFNGDGMADILLQNANGTLGDWTMDGSAIESAGNLTYQGNTVDLSAGWSVAGIGDFNGDNKSDVLLRNSDGTLGDWSMNGPTIDSAQEISFDGAAVTLPSSWSIVGVGDFNGDGMADILLRNANGSLGEWMMNGSQIESAEAVTYQGTAVSLNSSWTLAAIGDFNGDGKADLVWENSNGALGEWTMNGAAITSANSITSQGQPVSPTGWHVVATPTDLVFG
jgi:hypothetical protein